MAEQNTMEPWMITAQLGKEHQLLTQRTGEWNIVMRAWPSATETPMIGRGTSMITSRVGGRIFTEEFKAEFPGMPFEGFGTMGHDNFKNKFWHTWTDWTTVLDYADGEASADNMTITMYGRTDRPEINRKNVERRMVFRFMSDNNHIFEVHEKDQNGSEVKTLEVEYQRR